MEKNDTPGDFLNTVERRLLDWLGPRPIRLMKDSNNLTSLKNG